MFQDFSTAGLVFRRMIVQLRRIAFINKTIVSEGWIFALLISISNMGTPLLFKFWGLHKLKYKWTNFYQNLSVGSIWME